MPRPYRFEHPEVRSVIVTSGAERIFCAGANIYMLGQSDHGWKVNFCKFTNEPATRLKTRARIPARSFSRRAMVRPQVELRTGAGL